MKNSKNYLQVIEVSETREDVNAKVYKRIIASALPGVIEHPVTGEMVPVIEMNARKVSFNQYEESYLDGSTDPAFNAPVGSLLPGAVVTKIVEPYSFEVTNKTTGEVETITTTNYSTAVFGDTSEAELFQTAIFAAFRNNSHPLEGDPFVAKETQIELTEEPTEEVA